MFFAVKKNSLPQRADHTSWKPTVNPDLKSLDITTLVDLLARTTQRYTELFAEKKFAEEYDECKRMIEILQEEIGLRIKKTPAEDRG